MPGLAEAHFTECTGLAARVTPITYQEGGTTQLHRIPGPVDYAEVHAALRASPTPASCGTGSSTGVTGKVQRQNVSIVVLDPDGITPRIQWDLIRAWASEWRGAPLDAMCSEIAIETVSLVYEGLAGRDLCGPGTDRCTACVPVRWRRASVRPRRAIAPEPDATAAPGGPPADWVEKVRARRTAPPRARTAASAGGAAAGTAVARCRPRRATAATRVDRPTRAPRCRADRGRRGAAVGRPPHRASPRGAITASRRAGARPVAADAAAIVRRPPRRRAARSPTRWTSMATVAPHGCRSPSRLPRRTGSDPPTCRWPRPTAPAPTARRCVTDLGAAGTARPHGPARLADLDRRRRLAPSSAARRRRPAPASRSTRSRAPPRRAPVPTGPTGQCSDGATAAGPAYPTAESSPEPRRRGGRRPTQSTSAAAGSSGGRLRREHESGW